MKPASLLNLINSLASMPGISKKQAEKIALLIVTKKQKEAKILASDINNALITLTKCKNCFHLSEDSLCSICQDSNRLKVLIIVESSLDVFKFEEMQQIKPYYHVLGGLINTKDQSVDHLNLANLVKRARDFQEIIIALSPNLEGIVTANYLKVLLKDKKVTQLAQGIPLGAAMEYVDKLTLKAALDNRKEVK